ncbi:MAG: hypothetical protein M0Z50_00750 [Planctomycetia bacterium]|nr:hypothetical protein [Planctomycetia bacterium]
MNTSSIPFFQVPGIVAEYRELQTKQGKTWCHLVKVVAMGGTFDLQTTDEKLAKSVAVGQNVVAKGAFEIFNGSWKFIVKEFQKPA